MKPKGPADSCLTQWALIDGEAVVFRDDGRSTFVSLLTKGGGARASLVAFDLLRLDSEDLARRGRPTMINVLREALRALTRPLGKPSLSARALGGTHRD